METDQTGGRRAVSAAGLHCKGFGERSVFVHGRRYHHYQHCRYHAYHDA